MTTLNQPMIVIGDIHGQMQDLAELFVHLDDYINRAPTKIVFVGDYVDRGPDSCDVINYVRHLQANNSLVVALKGNHEDMMADHADPMVWMMNGGNQTIASYEPSGGTTGQQFQEHVKWCDKLPLFHVHNSVAVAHAGIHGHALCEDNSDYYLLWSRDLRTHQHDHYKYTVHGHTPMKKPVVTEHVAYIDTGAVFGGDLTALWIPDTVDPKHTDMITINHKGIIQNVV